MNIFGPRWPYWIGTTIAAAAGVEAIFRDYQRATFMLVLGGLVLHGWWLGLLTDRVRDLSAQIKRREAP